ncbi:hypothetical protein FD754_016962, partial [Muntiacus muntjak]
MLVLWEGPEEAPGGPGMGGHGTSAEASARQDQEDKWLPITKLGCLVTDMKIKSLEEIYLRPVQTRFKASVTIGTYYGACHSPSSLCDEMATGGTRLEPHMGPCRVTGRCGSVLVRLTPASRGCTVTLGNFTKAIFDTISKTHSYLTSDLWKETVLTKSLYQNT